jgi:hypothetical protein
MTTLVSGLGRLSKLFPASQRSWPRLCYTRTKSSFPCFLNPVPPHPSNCLNPFRYMLDTQGMYTRDALVNLHIGCSVIFLQRTISVGPACRVGDSRSRTWWEAAQLLVMKHEVISGVSRGTVMKKCNPQSQCVFYPSHRALNVHCIEILVSLSAARERRVQLPAYQQHIARPAATSSPKVKEVPTNDSSTSQPFL